ncbi:MAG: prepilin-type N-terminal cleavage/methylation domain-containing protein [Bacilli bacterium]|nr:prepilin-type N-terminal cleavage/methylation domain-containing protein [Bacilli bacterium]
MKNNKGFTLIELLAVIVILAIIAVIATPIILGVIDDARTKAAENSAYGALDAVKSYYATSQIGDTPVTLPITINFGTPEAGELAGTVLSMSGTKPTAGTITLATTGAFTVGTALTISVSGTNYSCSYASNEFTCAKAA